MPASRTFNGRAFNALLMGNFFSAFGADAKTARSKGAAFVTASSAAAAQTAAASGVAAVLKISHFNFLLLFMLLFIYSHLPEGKQRSLFSEASGPDGYPVTQPPLFLMTQQRPCPNPPARFSRFLELHFGHSEISASILILNICPQSRQRIILPRK